jgi:uncharacterized protein (TIGR03435 family)
MRYVLGIALTVAVLIPGMIITAAQNQPLKFEVATIKANNTTGGGQNVRRLCRGVDTLDQRVESIPLGRCLFDRAPLDYLIAVAYRNELRIGWSRPPKEVVTGGPGWIHDDRFDVEGKAENQSVTGGDLYRMLRTLLSERFSLVVHTASKEVQGYALVVAKNGPRLVAAKDKEMRPTMRGTPSTSGVMTSTAQNNSMATLAASLTNLGIGPVVDETGLAGTYDFTLAYGLDSISATGRKDGAAIPSQPGSGPSLFTALREQLGLELISKKVTSAFLVVDHVERPAAN